MIPFSPPYISDEVIEEVVDSLKSGWITTGIKVKLLEKEVGDCIDSPHVLCVNSWTSGAIMVMRWLGLEEGDEVIIPAYTYCATALAVIHAGGTPVMVDVGDDFNIDVNKIEEKITPRTKAIMPVDFAGFPCNYDEIMDLVKNPDIQNKFNPTSPNQKKLNRIMVISDAAHSLGASYNGKRFGTSADMTIFSFHAVKNITTAEGGAIAITMPVTFDNAELYKELRLMTLNCQTKDAFTKSKAGGWKYDIIGLGMKINMADVNAAIGLAQIREYQDLLTRREEIFEHYADNLRKYEWAKIPESKDLKRESSYHIFPLRINSCTEDQRDQMILELAEAGVSVNVHFRPLPVLSYFKSLGYDIADFPNSFENYAAEISLPIYPQLTLKDVNYITDSIVSAYKKVFSR